MSLENNTSQKEEMVSLLRNDGEFLNAQWTCWHSLDMCILAQTPPCIRQQFTFPYSSKGRVGSHKGTYTYHRARKAGTGSLSETKAGWPALPGAMQSLILCIHVLSSLLPGPLPLLQPTHKQRCSNPSMPAQQQFKFPFASLRWSHFSHEPHRSEVKG